ncbi:MAG: type II secretion system F family protein, partial [Burkholderiaceae bacterium]
PPLLIQLISTVERSGELAAMLSLAAEQMTQDLRRRTLLLTSFLEPALILGMGLVVLLIVLAVMMPLIEMNTLLR